MSRGLRPVGSTARMRLTSGLGRLLLVLCASALLASPRGALGVDLRARTTTSSKQFTIYCEDVALRNRVAGFVEDVKGGVCTTLGLAPWGKIPIVVTLEVGEAATPAKVMLAQTPDGPTIQVRVKIGGDPAAVHLEKHIIRAVLLDVMYRERPQPQAGSVYPEPPWWVVSGIIEINRRRDRGVE